MESEKPIKRTSKKDRQVPEWQLEEAAKLKAIYDKWAVESGMSQEKFGADTGIGTQGAVWQYLVGRTPLNVDAAAKFAKKLNCSIDDFSPRLADMLRAAFEVVQGIPNFSSQTIAIAKMVESLDDKGKESVQEDVQKEKLWQDIGRKAFDPERKAG